MPPAPAEFSRQSQVVSKQRSRTRCERGHDALEAGLEAGAEMRPDVEDDRVGVDRAGDVDGVLERRDRLLVELVVRARQVDEVERVAEHPVEADLGPSLLEALEVGGVVVRRPPGARALGEHLHRVAADRLDAIDRRVDPSGGRDVGADVHPPTIRA